MTPPLAGVYGVRASAGDTEGSFQLALSDSIGGKIVCAVAARC